MPLWHLKTHLQLQLETIQAMITLGLSVLPFRSMGLSWVLISSGTRMAIDVRLMRNASDEDNPRVQSSASLNNINRQRTWATVYFVEYFALCKNGEISYCESSGLASSRN